MNLNNIDQKQLQDVEKKLKENKDKLENLIREYPLVAIAVALGAGYVIAKLLNSGKNKQ